MAIKRTASALWNGTGLEGKGVLNSSNKFFDNTPYSTKARFENEDGQMGTNPEELLAAAHAGCFTMALSFAIANAGFTADELKTDAVVTIEKEGNHFSVTGIELKLHGKVTGMEEAKFVELANGAKEGCPISKALSAVPITLTTHFVS